MKAADMASHARVAELRLKITWLCTQLLKAITDQNHFNFTPRFRFKKQQQKNTHMKYQIRMTLTGWGDVKIQKLTNRSQAGHFRTDVQQV